jgi:hypothetical protein
MKNQKIFGRKRLLKGENYENAMRTLIFKIYKNR